MPSTKMIKYIGTQSYKVWKKDKEQLCEAFGIKKKTESEMKRLWVFYQKETAFKRNLRKQKWFQEKISEIKKEQPANQ